MENVKELMKSVDKEVNPASRQLLKLATLAGSKKSPMESTNLHLSQQPPGQVVHLDNVVGPINFVAISTEGQNSGRSTDSTQSLNQTDSDEKMSFLTSDANKDSSYYISQADNIKLHSKVITLVSPSTHAITKANLASMKLHGNKVRLLKPSTHAKTIADLDKNKLLNKERRNSSLNLPHKVSGMSSTNSDTEEEVSPRKKSLRQPQMHSPISSVQKRSYKKRSEEDICKELVSKRDKKILFNELSKELDAETIRQKYDEKKKECNEENLLVEATKTDLTYTTAIMSSLQKTLIAFSSLANEDFIFTMLKTFGKRLKASAVLEILDKNELIAAVCLKFRDIDLFNLLDMKNDPDVIQKVLETAPVSAIEHLVQTQEKLKTSEQLLNVLLKNGPKILSEETKCEIKDVLMKKFATTELAALLTDIIKVHMANSVIEI